MGDDDILEADWDDTDAPVTSAAEDPATAGDDPRPYEEAVTDEHLAHLEERGLASGGEVTARPSIVPR